MSNAQAAPPKTAVLTALRHLEGRATVGDVVASAGLPRDQVESTLKELLETRKGHLEVSDSGELTYLFDKRLIRRNAVSTLERLKQTAARVLTQAFKAWIVATLVVYFALFVVLAIAAVVAMMSRGGDNRRGGGWGGGRRGNSPLPNLWLFYYFWPRRWHRGRRYYGRRHEKTLEKDDPIPFYKKVFAFVFGPDRPTPNQAQLDRSTLRLIRARKGVLTSAELVEHRALPLHDADEEMGRLMGAYAGEPMVSNDGELVYAFPELMVSAHGPVTAREPNPAWQRLEYPLELTGNEKKADAVIIGMNAFNLLAAATAPWFIFPQLGFGGIAAVVGLVLIPVVFSVLFFTVPLLRTFSVRRENRARRNRNLRRVVLGLVYQEALAGGGSVTVDEALTHCRTRLDPEPERSEVEQTLHELASEFDADVEVDQSGATAFRFPEVRRQFVASENLRRRLRLEKRQLGATVYSSADTAMEASQRDLAAMDRTLASGATDRELQAADMNLSAYLPSPDRVGFEDDFEVVAFEEELARSRVTAA